MDEEISGEKIRCHGHKVERPFKMKCASKDGHHEMCVIVKSGKCIVLKDFRWKRK